MGRDLQRSRAFADRITDDVDIVAALAKETSPPLRVEITWIRQEANPHPVISAFDRDHGLRMYGLGVSGYRFQAKRRRVDPWLSCMPRFRTY